MWNLLKKERDIKRMKTIEQEGLVILAAGIALGLLAGLLWAPRSGRDTRHELRRAAQDNLDYLIEEAERVRDGTDRLVDDSRKWLARFKNPRRNVKAGAEPGLEGLKQ